jgi:hypothetical protein
MASTVAGPTDVSKASQVQENQSAPKAPKQPPHNAASPQDSVTISSEARAAQQASHAQQNGADAERGGSKN